MRKLSTSSILPHNYFAINSLGSGQETRLQRYQFIQRTFILVATLATRQLSSHIICSKSGHRSSDALSTSWEKVLILQSLLDLQIITGLRDRLLQLGWIGSRLRPLCRRRVTHWNKSLSYRYTSNLHQSLLPSACYPHLESASKSREAFRDICGWFHSKLLLLDCSDEMLRWPTG